MKFVRSEQLERRKTRDTNENSGRLLPDAVQIIPSQLEIILWPVRLISNGVETLVESSSQLGNLTAEGEDAVVFTEEFNLFLNSISNESYSYYLNSSVPLQIEIGSNYFGAYSGPRGISLAPNFVVRDIVGAK